MYIDQDRCLQCGNRVRPSLAEDEVGAANLSSDGTFRDTPYWFCCVECYRKAVGKFLNPRFWFDKSVYDDPEFRALHRKWYDDYNEGFNHSILWMLFHKKGRSSQSEWMEPHLAPFREQWMKTKVASIIDAENTLIERIQAEVQHEAEQRVAEAEEKARKEQERLEEKRQRDEERARKEQERLEEKRQREEERARKEQERIEEKREREEEKRRKEQEKLDEQLRKEREAAELERQREEQMKERDIPQQARFSHTHVLGASGSGKTTLIIKHVKEDMDRRERPAVIVIDPKGTLVDRFSRHQAFSLPLRSRFVPQRLVLIDPTRYAPALNMFAKPKRTYTGALAEQVENNTISLFQYIFASKDSALTDKQLTCFSYAMKLLMTIPDATIQTFLDLLEDPCIPKAGGIKPGSPFKPYIERLDEITQRFFYRNFYDASDYAPTKEQIASRLHGVLRYPSFKRMLVTKENNLDMFDLLQDPAGKVILISSPVAVLGTDGSRLFSRYMVALALQAVFERTAIPRDQWRPAYLYIDEAQLVVDETKTQDLLQLAREFKLGCTILHHQIKGEITEKIFSTLSANTRIKYASTTSYDDAFAMSKDMRCTPQFILDRKPNEEQTHGSFACFCNGVTPHPFVYELDYAQDNAFPTMSEPDYRAVCKHMERAYGARDRGTDKVSQPEDIQAQATAVNAPDAAAGPEEQPQAAEVVPGAPAPAKAPQPAADPHTGTHTEPASTWGA